ncbi:hypothetical protein C1645_543917 [Glomus cerebriforme]|uniref:Uncharacterized protein n=1 Tax=Glomus cerebriforme TaxID=658196 RepID=A0A397T924_9GLOM|nr:hypothetical protein C1645_543917 [Glomus cerebriforme]
MRRALYQNFWGYANQSNYILLNQVGQSPLLFPADFLVIPIYGFISNNRFLNLIIKLIQTYF